MSPHLSRGILHTCTLLGIVLRETCLPSLSLRSSTLPRLCPCYKGPKRKLKVGTRGAPETCASRPLFCHLIPASVLVHTSSPHSWLIFWTEDFDTRFRHPRSMMTFFPLGVSSHFWLPVTSTTCVCPRRKSGCALGSGMGAKLPELSQEMGSLELF